MVNKVFLTFHTKHTHAWQSRDGKINPRSHWLEYRTGSETSSKGVRNRWILKVTGKSAQKKGDVVQPLYKYTIHIMSIDKEHEASRDIKIRLNMDSFPQVINVELRAPGYVPNQKQQFSGKFTINSVELPIIVPKLFTF